MAEAPISISKHDWDRQKDNFIDLYHRRKLPLQSKNGGPSVIQSMRDEHKFCASLSQYEAQIRRWDMPKNLKRSEWAHIIAKMDDLKSGGVDSRLKLAGSLVSADKIKQKRRRYSRAIPTPSIEAESLPGPFPWDSPRFTLEILAHNGQWSPYREGDASSQTTLHATLSSPVIDTASRTMNDISAPSNISPVHHPRQRSIDEDAIRGLVPTMSSDDALPLPWPRDNAANVESYCLTEHMEAVLDPIQDTLAGENERNKSPRLPDYRSSEIFNILRMERGFALSPSSQDLLQPSANAARSPFSPPAESLIWSPIDGIVDASLFKLLEDSPFLLLEKDIRNLRATSMVRSEQSYLVYESCYSSTQMLTLTQRHRGQGTASIFREIESIASIAQLIPNFLGQERLIQNRQFNKFVNCLESLLPDNLHEASDNIGVFDDSSLTASRLLESPFHRAILYSTINGFAGLSRFPALPLIKAYSSLLGLVKSHPSFAVRSFIDNAFSAAVWNGNAQAVDFLLRMTYGTSYAIDVNKTLASKSGIPSMPIVVALTYSCHPGKGQRTIPRQQLETAEVLLKAGAASTPALRHLMSDWRCPNAANVGFIRKLLDRGAKTEWESIQHSMGHGTEELTELLLAHIPRASYQLYFQDPEIQQEFNLRIPWEAHLPILACIALYLRNSTATHIIRSVLCEWPRSRIEKECPGTYERTMDFTLIHACAKGNKELVELLLPLVPRASSAALVAAIRSRQQPLVDLLLESGVNVKDKPIYLTSRSYNPQSYNMPSQYYPYPSPPYPYHPHSHHPHSYHPHFSRSCRCREIDRVSNLLKLLPGVLCTPLAQAIRSRNQQLVRKLEYTLSRAEKWYLEEALEAAADVGDLDYLLMLLDSCSVMDLDGIHRKRALCLAIEQNRDDTAFALLKDGVDVYGSNTRQLHSATELKAVCPLLSAIRGHRKELIEAILEHEPDVSSCCYIRAAALLGDADIIKVLLSSQAAVSLRALRTAQKTGNENMLNFLLDYFWRHNPLFPPEHIQFPPEGDDIGDLCLADIVKSAVHSKDATLLISFLEHGARVDNRAIALATRMEDPAIVELLLASAVRPDIALDAIVKLKNQTILRQWLSKGTGHLTEDAFLYAMRLDKHSFAILMEAFKARYPNGLKGWGGSILKNAIRRGNSSLLKELLAARMDVNSLGRYTIMQNKEHVYRNDPIRSTPLGFAIYRMRGENIDDVHMLLDAGSEPNGIARATGFVGSDSDYECLNWKTPLLLAIETGDLELVQVILRGGADVNLAARNGRKRTPLQRACELCSFPMVELLLSWQADVNGEAATRAGGTALQLTAIGGSIKIARVLLQNGADIRAQCAKIHGRTPFEGAAEYGRLDMLKLIWDATFPEGIPMEEASNAIHFARKNGHQVCEQYIRYLIPTADISELSENQNGIPWGSRSQHHLRQSYSSFVPRIGDESDSEDTEKAPGSDDEISSGEEDWGSDYSDDSLP